jgi:hypothetical protein
MMDVDRVEPKKKMIAVEYLKVKTPVRQPDHKNNEHQTIICIA